MTASQPYSSDVDEMLSRVRRLETKVHKIALHLGVEVETSSDATPVDATTIRVTGFDVTLALVRRVAETMDTHQPITLVDSSGHYVGTLRFSR